MRAPHNHGVRLQADQVGQHFAAVKHRDVARARADHFDVVLSDSRRNHNDTSVANVVLVMARGKLETRPNQALSDFRRMNIRTRDFVSEIEQDLR